MINKTLTVSIKRSLSNTEGKLAILISVVWIAFTLAFVKIKNPFEYNEALEYITYIGVIAYSGCLSVFYFKHPKLAPLAIVFSILSMVLTALCVHLASQ